MGNNITHNEMHIMKDMRLPFIFYRNRASGDRAPDPRNWHENIELLYFMEGMGAVQCNDETVAVVAGDLVVVNANVPHTVIAKSQQLHYCYLIVDRGFSLANGLDTNELQFDVHIRDKALRDAMECLLVEYEDSGRAYRIPTIRSLVLQILVILCRQYSHPAALSQGQPNLLSCIQKAIGYIRIEYASDLSLDDIAARVGLSKYYFSREFRRVTGYPFVSYVNIVRCEQAKRLLTQTQMRVGDVATACGFANPSYFTRTFLNMTGMRPLAYREKKKQG